MSRERWMGLRPLVAFVCVAFVGCDSNGGADVGAGAGSGGAAGQSASGGVSGMSAEPRPTLISPHHYGLTPASESLSQAGNSGSGGGAAATAGTGGSGGSAGAALGLSCVPELPAGSPSNLCGDGFLSAGEQCDDGNTQGGDACSAACVVTPMLVAPHAGSAGALPFPSRALGNGAHPAAVGCNRVGIAFSDRVSKPSALKLAMFSSLGRALGVSDIGVENGANSDPSITALPDDSFVAVWTAFDSDELGIRMRKVASQADDPAKAGFANVEQAFSQRSADIVFDGRQLIVTWVDDSDPATGPDLRYRTFAPDLTPTSDDQTLSASSAVEDRVTLAALDGAWAAAWRSGSTGSETIEVQRGASHWSVGPFLPGASDDRPALAFVDKTHLALAFTAGTDPFASSVAAVPRLHAAVLDAAYPGHVESFEVKPVVEPAASLLGVAQTQPAIVSFGDRLAIAWRSSSVVGDPAGNELWSREIKWSLAANNSLTIDTSAVERPLIAPGALRAGDQARPVLLTSSQWPNHRLLSAWEDSGRNFGSAAATTDVAVQFSPVPGELQSDPTGPCTAVTIAISPAGPAVDFRSLTLTGTATCGAGTEAEYQFYYQDPAGTSWTIIRDWGSATANWNTAGLPSGNYPVYVYARRKGSTSAFEAIAGVGYLVGSVCYKDATFSITPSGVQPIGTVFSLNASATCSGTGTVPEHHSFYQLPGSPTWTEVGPWSTGAQSWDTAGFASGNYTLLSHLRGHGNTSGSESYVYGAVLLGNVCYKMNSISGSPASPQGVGATIALSGSATCVGATVPEFLYYYYLPGSGTPIQIGNWSASPVNWVTTGLPPGNYNLLAAVRGVGNQGVEASGYGAFQLGNLCPSVSLSTMPAGVQPIGTSLTLTATAGCNQAEYQFWYRLWGASQWNQIRGWGPSPSLSWDTTGLASGNYEARVDARIAGHLASETNTEIGILLGNVCGAGAVTASPASPHAVGTSVALSATATCTNGGSAEYQFYYRAPGSAQLVMIRDWGPATVTWNTNSLAPGAYETTVYVRASGNLDTYDSVGQSSYTLQ